MTTALVVGGALVAVISFIGYAIYRAHTDPFVPPTRREVILVPYPEASMLVESGEGWRIAPEEDYNGNGDLVYLERFVPCEPKCKP